MADRIIIAALALAALAGCGGGGQGNEAVAANEKFPAEEGYDPNMVIGGDELSPLPEEDVPPPSGNVMPANRL
jgi:hypothetical protein